MKCKIVRNSIYLFFLIGILLATVSAEAQTIAYRQANLASDVPGLAQNLSPSLQNSWGIAFQPGQAFLIANTGNGRALALNANGAGTAPVGFNIPSIGAIGVSHPVGIVADSNSLFGGRDFHAPFILVTQDGGIYEWGPDAQGDLPVQATLVFNGSRQNAVYKGVAILTPAGGNATVAVTDFHGGSIQTFLAGFAQVTLAGSFTDPNLPEGYAPFGMQTIGNQVFVTYALQNAAKNDPIAGAGNGTVSIFDMNGNFVRRFASGGPLNAPWGVTQAGAHFGPFSNDILIGNVGDGTINAFDPANGNFVGTVKDNDGNAIVNPGLHGLTFRTDGFGDANSLYITAGIGNGADGVFAAITSGLVSSTRVSVPPSPANLPAPVTVTVSGGPGNPGTPTGQVVVEDGGVQIASIGLLNGQIAFPEIFTKLGTHVINARYGGDRNFLPSSSQIEVDVTGAATTLTFTVPANAAPGLALTLSATVNSAAGIATGQVVFHDGNTSLGSATLDGTGSAILRINSLTAGTHTLTATYSGDDKFAGSTSAAETITIGNPDFSLSAAPPAATVVAGQSTQFILTVTPAGGFANNVTLTCSPASGITCAFSPATVSAASGTSRSTLTVTTSANVPIYGFTFFATFTAMLLLAAMAWRGFLSRRGRTLQSCRGMIPAYAAALTIFALSMSLSGCGGYGSSTKPNRGTASIVVTAQSGSVSHNTTVMVTVQ